MKNTELELVDISFRLNGRDEKLSVPADMSGLKLIRDVLGLKGTKEGCSIGECGACTILVNRQAVNSCLLPAPQLDGAEVCTIEGLNHEPGFQALQEAFLHGHAVQCGFCTPGMLISIYALLLEEPRPNREDVIRAISGNLCRCTGYQQILNAVDQAINQVKERDADVQEEKIPSAG